MGIADFSLGVAAGLVGGVVTSFSEPAQRAAARFGRSVSRDSGVRIHVESDPRVIWAGYPPWVGAEVYVPGSPGRHVPPFDALDWLQWAERNGGCAAHEAVVQVTMVGESPTTVVLSPPQVEARQAGELGGFHAIRPVGGAEISPRSITVDLDTFGLQSPIVDMGADSVHGPSMPSSWSLAKGDVEVFLFRVRASHYALIEWSASLPILIDGKRRFLSVDNDGKPFRLAGADGLESFLWDGDSWSARRED